MKNLSASIYFELNNIIGELPSLIFHDNLELLKKLQKLSNCLLDLSDIDTNGKSISLLDKLSDTYHLFYKALPLNITSSNEVIHRSNRIIRGDIAHHQGLFDYNSNSYCEV